mmetsp:Transcript_112385/g.324654  ORF Transcript_112385/g.324654 Transcript_112385/m.324654 type:complete len:208 (+) Transcript_112385:1177-1800(+)
MGGASPTGWGPLSTSRVPAAATCSSEIGVDEHLSNSSAAAGTNTLPREEATGAEAKSRLAWSSHPHRANRTTKKNVRGSKSIVFVCACGTDFASSFANIEASAPPPALRLLVQHALRRWWPPCGPGPRVRGDCGSAHWRASRESARGRRRGGGDGAPRRRLRLPQASGRPRDGGRAPRRTRRRCCQVQGVAPGQRGMKGLNLSTPSR